MQTLIIKAAVESELGISDPIPTDMLLLTSLVAYGRLIVDLTGIEYAMNLTGLFLLNNQIKDISPLSGLTNLGLLELSNNQISDTSPLSGMTNLTRLWLYNNPLNVEAHCIYLPLIEVNNSGIDLSYDPCPYSDGDEDGMPDVCDNCPYHHNPDQQDTYPPGGNNIGDACDCECDFNCDGNVDASDVTSFLIDFGRSTFFSLCTNADPCNGDVDCNVNVDALDVNKFLEDFGRSQYNNPWPACEVMDCCVY